VIPDRGDYAPCECARAQDEGVEVCGGCEEYRAARALWARELAPVIPLCSTCRLWGKGSCKAHQGPRGRRAA
jgi:hypothetical protein